MTIAGRVDGRKRTGFSPWFERTRLGRAVREDFLCDSRGYGCRSYEGVGSSVEATDIACVR
jgi:hypothetical protein